MKQETFTDIEYSYRKKKTKREEFLEIMEEIIPWDEWVGVIEPYYPKGKRGRPPMGIEKMLRMYLLQIWFNLSDPATEDAIYDSYAMRKFTGIDFMTETVPDETTLCKFRHLLETNGLNKLFFDAINRVMVQTGHMMKGGTIVDATIINAPSSTKNAEKKRDPEMHQTKKGNEWKFGMKCHIGVDAGSGLVHTITVTAANEHDITQAAALIREDDEVVYGDAGYLGILVEIRGVAQTLYQNAGTLVPGVLRQQAGVMLRRHIGQVRHGAADHLHPFVGGEHRLFVAVDQHADVHLVKALGGPADNIHMPQRDGVEAAGIDRNFHGGHSSLP